MKQLDSHINILAEIFKPVGPTNFQFRKTDKGFLLLEINPRISSSNSMRTSFGFNEAEMCIEYFLLGKVPEIRNIRKGMALRYYKDYILYEDGNNI